jgi:cobalt-zinc-cadmium efflux system membrane fusion protein
MIRTTKLLVGALVALALVGCGDSNSGSTQPSSSNNKEASSAHRHDTPGETCFICDETKRDPGRLWCKEHARYEDRCWECQPQLEEKGRLYCEEHGLYEDECFLCHPELRKDSDDDKNSKLDPRTNTGSGLFCREHQVPEAECGICQPQRTAQLEPGDELKVRFESTRSASKAGVQTVPARQATVQASVAAFCEISYNENALARITPLAAGIVRKVLVDVGQDVKAGDVLIELHSTEVASAKAAFVSAVVDLALKEVACQREKRLAKKNISSEKEVQEADAACKIAELTLSTAKQALLNYGFTEEEVAAIEKDRDTSAVLLVRAPYEGTLVERSAVIGEAVQPGQSLFSLADLKLMWLSLSIPADQAGLIRTGLAVEATFQGLLGEPTRGEITWVNTSIDEKSRMLRARAVVINGGRRLSAGMFGDARVFVGDAQASVDVPKDAIQRIENKPYVFVKLEDDLYSLRRVATVARPSNNMVAVIAGLQPDEPVVATGAFTVMSEFLKSRLGAGCVDD